jgi:hypothetical protein
MRRLACTFLGMMCVLLSGFLAAQDKAANIGRVYVLVPKPGMVKQFEAGRKKHMDFHRKQNDTWSWETWELMTGPATGSYLSGTFNHTFKDFDDWEQKLGTADGADSEVNLLPYITPEADNGFWMYLKEISRPLESIEMPKMAEVNHFLLKPGGQDNFNDAAKKITDAIGKTNWPAHYSWYSLVDGGQGPHYVLVLYMNGWADLAEPDPPFDAMLEKALGKHDAQALMHAVDDSIQKEWTETMRFRSDMSYIPGAK